MDIDKIALQHEYCEKPFCAFCYLKTNLKIQEKIDTLNTEQRTEYI